MRCFHLRFERCVKRMLDEIIASGSTGIIQKALDLLALRQRVLANNVANADVKGFRRSDVDFEKALSAVLATRTGGGAGLVVTQPRHIGGLGASQPGGDVVFQPDKPIPQGANSNVDIDEEMVAISENALLYETYATLLSLRLGALRAAIR